jgi:hypothetical protein
MHSARGPWSSSRRQAGSMLPAGPEAADDKRWQTVAPGRVEPSSGAIKIWERLHLRPSVQDDPCPVESLAPLRSRSCIIDGGPRGCSCRMFRHERGSSGVHGWEAPGPGVPFDSVRRC